MDYDINQDIPRMVDQREVAPSHYEMVLAMDESVEDSDALMLNLEPSEENAVEEDGIGTSPVAEEAASDETAAEETPEEAANDVVVEEEPVADNEMPAEEVEEEVTPEVSENEATMDDDSEEESSADEEIAMEETDADEGLTVEETPAGESDATDEVVMEEAVDEVVVEEPVEEATEEPAPVMDETVVIEEEPVEDEVVMEEPAEEVVAEEVVEETEEVAEVVVPKLPTREDLIECANRIIEALDDGFQWGDIPVIMKAAFDFVDDFIDMSADQKRGAVVGVINHVIDVTDTPWLPDGITDPIFKALVPPFVDLILPDEALEALNFDIPQELIDFEDYQAVARDLVAKFSDGFNWSDLVFATRVGIKFASDIPELDVEQRVTMAKRVLDTVIDETDTPWLPDGWTDPIFKQFSHAMIDLAVK